MAGGRDDARTSRVLRGVAVGAVTLLLCFWAFFGGASNRIDTGIDFDGRTEATYGGGSYTPFGAVGGESTRRSMEPQEMCSWETALEGHTYDEIYEKEGWPTRYEQRVDERLPLKDVFCPVCGAHKQVIKFRGADVREEGKCPRCGSFNRIRQLAEVILPEVSRITGRRVGSLKELVASDLRIFNTQCRGVVHNVLRKAPSYVCSEFINADVPRGSVVEGIRHEDLQRTTFKDSTFDLIISSEIFSRVPRPYQALHELRRIMRPGGAHVFTVPFSPADYHDQMRAIIEDGKLVHWALPPIYAGDHLHPKGVLVFTIFGRELADKMCMLGYNTTVHHLHNGPHGIIGHNAWVFSAVRPEA